MSVIIQKYTGLKVQHPNSISIHHNRNMKTNFRSHSSWLKQLALITAVASVTTMKSSSSSSSALLRPFTPPSNLCGVFVGSGSDGMSDPRIAQLILQMAASNQQKQKQNHILTVLYLGTATYDLDCFFQRQTQWFANHKNCRVTSLALADPKNIPSPQIIETRVKEADILVVGGGNTLFAVDRWKLTPGLIPLLRQAMQRGAVLTGGSAGAICWFDGGHSDSMDPDTFQRAMMERFGSSSSSATTAATTVEESSSFLPNAAVTSSTVKDWKYIRVPGLGFLPGLVCPHHDRIQSNGVLRAEDFDQMLLTKHSGEVGIGIDHWAALVVEGDSYRVVSLDGKPGSAMKDDFFCPSSNEGVPAVWIKRVCLLTATGVLMLVDNGLPNPDRGTACLT